MTTRKKIGFVMYGYPLGVSLSIINAAIVLAGRGYQANIFIDTATFNSSSIDFKNENIVIHAIDTGSDRYKGGF